MELKDNTYQQMIDFATSEILEQVLGGKKSLRNALVWVVDVTSRWGYERKMKSNTVLAAMKRAQAVLNLASARTKSSGHHLALENLMKALNQ